MSRTQATRRKSLVEFQQDLIERRQLLRSDPHQAVPLAAKLSDQTREWYLHGHEDALTQAIYMIDQLRFGDMAGSLGHANR